MSDSYSTNENKLEKVFLSERFLTIIYIFMIVAGIVSLFFCIKEQESFEIFALIIELVTATAMCFSFRSFKWDAAKGLLGGVLFCLMYQEAHLALARLWMEQDFDVYLSAGVQGSLFLAGAGMNLLAMFAFTCYFVAQMWLNILRMIYLTLVILQVLALAIYMWGPEKLKHRWQRIPYRILYASSFFVIPAFLFIFMGLISQYHVRISDSIDAASMPVEEILGVTNALYMDMGAGWNYSWYRNVAGKVITFFGLPVPWSHNWIIFQK